jgi:hypothetical protein
VSRNLLKKRAESVWERERRERETERDEKRE